MLCTFVDMFGETHVREIHLSEFDMAVLLVGLAIATEYEQKTK